MSVLVLTCHDIVHAMLHDWNNWWLWSINISHQHYHVCTDSYNLCCICVAMAGYLRYSAILKEAPLCRKRKQLILFSETAFCHYLHVWWGLLLARYV